MKLSRRSWAIVALGLAVFAAAWWFGFVAPSRAVAVTSRSMSHADVDLPGIMDPGETITLDGVHAPGDVVTFVEGRRTGHVFAGDFGEPVSYQAVVGGRETNVGIVHRAMAWVVYNASVDAYDVPELGLVAVRSFAIEGVGRYDALRGEYVHETMSVQLDPATAGRHDGFLMKGDHNDGFDQDPRGALEGLGVVELVDVAHARGKVVGFTEGDAVLRNFWVALGVAGVVAAGAGLFGRQLRAMWGRAKAPRGGDACASCGRPVAASETFCLHCGAVRKA